MLCSDGENPSGPHDADPLPVGFSSGGSRLQRTGTLLSGYNLEWVGYYCIFAGVATGGVAMVAGFADIFLYVVRHGAKALRKAWIHATIQSAVIIGFTLLFSAEYNHPGYITDVPEWLWVSKGLLCGMMIAGNHIGGVLVFSYVAKEFGQDNRRA